MITVSSVYSASFYSDGLASAKHRRIKDVCAELLKLKNKLSIWTQERLLECVRLKKHEYCTLTQPLVSHISSHFYKALKEDVYTAYSNRFDAIKKRMSRDIKVYVKTEYYKRDCKGGKKGAIKRLVYKEKSTDVSKTVTFLTKCGICQKYPANIQRIIAKFGIERLLALATMRRENVLARYPEPVTFTKMTFRGRSRLKVDVVSRNRNKNSVINGFVTISWLDEPMIIPVKISSAYHKNLKEYTNGRDTSYTIQVTRKGVRVILTRDGERNFPDISLDENEISGIDVNTKHNMFVTTDDYEVDHNYRLINALVKHEKRTDELRTEAKKQRKDYQIGKKREAKSESLSSKIIDDQEREVARYCKEAYERGIRHVVLENLQGCWGTSYAKSKEHDVNYNRIVKAMQIASVKDAFLHIAPHYHLTVSLVNPAYTSQTCPRCGAVHRENRKTQEDFECIECGYKDNADKVGSFSTKQRISNAVLRGNLSVLNDDKTGFVPNGTKYKDIKTVLSKCRTIVWSNPCVENS